MSVMPARQAKASLRCLWIGRDLPFPADAGDKIYSGELAAALASSHAEVRFMGFPSPQAQPPLDWQAQWLPVSGAKGNDKLALFSSLPRVAAIHDTLAYRHLLKAQFQEHWDAVIIDGYGSGWALQPFLTAYANRAERPLLIYTSHNNETAVWRGLSQSSLGGPLKKLAVYGNYRKVRTLEQRLVRHADLITTITDEDAQSYTSWAPHTPGVVLTPGYSGTVCAARRLTHDTPRRVVMVGSFRWIVKQENLRHFVSVAAPLLTQHRIELDIIGDMPTTLLAALRAQTPAIRFHGFVDDVSEIFSGARIAVVPEMVGGGFKLKFLDYIFSRLPVATIRAAAAGLPESVRQCLLYGDDFDSLLQAIVTRIDDLDGLNELQERAYAAALQQFRWQERGQRFHEAILAARTQAPQDVIEPSVVVSHA